MNTFFHSFTFDTFLGCISCALGILALLVSSKSYKKCKVLESSLNDQKEFKDNSIDNSQRAYRDINNYFDNGREVLDITNENFEKFMGQALSAFAEQSKANLQSIIEQTDRILREQKPNIAGLTKIDWINIYFESSKNTADKHMQNVWARLLAKELEHPGSFGYKTLDILKNISSELFKKFEILCDLEIEGWILQKDIHSNYGLSYLDIVHLSEHGLIVLGDSQQNYSFEAKTRQFILYNNFLILITNDSDLINEIHIPIYLLSTAAKELLCLMNKKPNDIYIKECVNYLSELNNNLKMELIKS